MSRCERELSGNPERRPLAFAERREKPNSLGVAVIIVGLDPSRNGENELDPLIWTVTELKSKPDTDKSAGQISIPAETRKDGEDLDNNVFGALAEFCNDTIFSSYIKQHLIKMSDQWYRERGIVVGTGRADVAVLIYNGALDFPFKPTNSDEVSPNGWMNKSTLVIDPRLRDVSKQALQLDSEEKLVRNVLKDYYSHPESRRSVFPEGLDSIERFSLEREFGVDIRTMSESAKEIAQRLPEAHKLIFEAIDLLVDAQSQASRDYEREKRIVLEFGQVFRNMDKGNYAVGIEELDGSRVRQVDLPKSWWEKNKKHREFYKKSYREKGQDLFRLIMTAEGSAKKSWGLWSLHRGDMLGYPKELGKDWYLTVRERGSSYYYVAPVSGIRNLKLRPHDVYGF